jgi:hypothetical protein
MKKYLLLVELVAGFLFSYFIITFFFSGERKFEDLALGTETVTYNAVDEVGKPIHIQKTDLEQSSELLKAWKARGEKPVILFLGNSQTHSINQQKEGEVNFIELLYKSRFDSKDDILCISLPNSGLQEFYLVYEYWQRLLPIKSVIIPVFMDDLREDGIRDFYFEELIHSKFQLEDTINQVPKKINSELRSYWQTNAPAIESLDSKSESAATLQDRSEAYLNHKLEKSKTWINRPNVRGEFFNWLYRFRNTVFRIKASTIRKMIPQRYQSNMESLSLLLGDCIKADKKVILYIPPIRSDVPLPYNKDEYELFKTRIKQFAAAEPANVYFKNFEAIIPGELWGYKAATSLDSEKEIDYMHFQFKGHQILADSLRTTLNQALYPDGL